MKIHGREKCKSYSTHVSSKNEMAPPWLFNAFSVPYKLESNKNKSYDFDFEY